jgi:hypothetical protein
MVQTLKSYYMVVSGSVTCVYDGLLLHACWLQASDTGLFYHDTRDRKGPSQWQYHICAWTVYYYTHARTLAPLSSRGRVFFLAHISTEHGACV